MCPRENNNTGQDLSEVSAIIFLYSTNFDPGQMQMIEESIMHIYWAAAYEAFQNHRLPESITAVVEEQSEPH